MLEKLEMKYLQKVEVTGNFPEYGKYLHNYPIGKKVYFIGRIASPKGGYLLQFTDNHKKKNVMNQCRQIMHPQQFKLCK